MTTTATARSIPPVRTGLRIYAALLTLLGVVPAGGGIMLVVDQDSFYYGLAGVACVLSGAMLWRADRRGVWIYGALLVATTAWALYEVGLSLWGLVARLVFLFVVGLPLLLPQARLLAMSPSNRRMTRGWPAFVVGLVVAALAGTGLHALAPASGPDPLYRTGEAIAAPVQLPQSLSSNARTDWIAYGNDQGGTRFSPLDQTAHP